MLRKFFLIPIFVILLLLLVGARSAPTLPVVLPVVLQQEVKSASGGAESPAKWKVDEKRLVQNFFNEVQAYEAYVSRFEENLELESVNKRFIERSMVFGATMNFGSKLSENGYSGSYQSGSGNSFSGAGSSLAGGGQSSSWSPMTSLGNDPAKEDFSRGFPSDFASDFIPVVGGNHEPMVLNSAIPSTVPEPGTFFLLGIGILGLAGKIF
jgi:hypothetical protein